MRLKNAHLKNYIPYLFIFFIQYIFGQGIFVFDSTLSEKISTVMPNKIKIADINNDNISDIIISGYDELKRDGVFLDIYVGNNQSSIDTLSLNIDNNYGYNVGFAKFIGGNGGLDLSDYNRDNFIDVLWHGSERIFLHKNINGTFNDSNFFDNYPLLNSDMKWGDVDMDGDPDIILMGTVSLSGNQYIFNNLYINDDNSFIPDNNIVLPGLRNGSAEWADIDQDGDLDLLMSGQSADPLSGVSRLYKNEPIGRLSEDANQEIAGLKGTASCFTDLDLDGDKDLIMSGWSPITQSLKTYIYINEPTGTFRLADEQIDFAIIYGAIESRDINSDGFPDFSISGVTNHEMLPDTTYDLTNIQTNFSGDTTSADTLWQYTYLDTVKSLEGKIFINNGDFTFNESQNFKGARNIVFLDINQDSKPDIISSGTTAIGNIDSTFCYVYINSTLDNNNIPNPPEVLESFAVSNRAIFNWGPGSDDIDPSQSLRYNLRIGRTRGSSELLSPSGSENHSNVGTKLIREFIEIPWGNYYWSVQTIDASGQLSAWSEEKTFFIPRLVASNQSIPGIYFGSSKWADINEDGNLDLAITGQIFSGLSVTKIFTYDNGLLTQMIQNNNIQSVYGGHINFVDYNNDGHLDLSLSGLQIYNFAPSPASLFYTWTNGELVEDTQLDVEWLLGGANNHDWGDYDNDGDLDLVIGGGNYYGETKLIVYKNNNGVLYPDNSQTNLIPLYPCIVSWNDINKDGFIDLITTGGGKKDSTSNIDTTLFTEAYLNNGEGLLIRSGNHFPDFGVTAGSIAIADYNNDGYDDVIISGKDNLNNVLVSKLLKNNNGENYSITQELPGVMYGELDWGDYDNDGDLDILLSGHSNIENLDNEGYGSDPITQIYEQKTDGFHLDTTLISIDSAGVASNQWGDYDNDGDLDLFSMGRLENKDFISKVYDNLEGIENPTSNDASIQFLSSTVKRDSVTLVWDDIPNQGSRYLLQVGQDQNNDLNGNTHSIISGNYSNKFQGSISNNSKFLKNISEGYYQWRVRSVNNSNSLSNWSEINYFYIDLSPPIVDTVKANYGVSGQIILVVKFNEAFEMDNISEIASPLIKITNPENQYLNNSLLPDTLSAIKQSYNSTIWTGLVTLPKNYQGKAIKIHISRATDMRGNMMSETIIYKTPEKVISQSGGSVASEDGKASILIPQNALSEDLAITINPKDNPSIILNSSPLSQQYKITPSLYNLSKPGIIRISIENDTSIVSPYIGIIDSETNTITNLGGTKVSINNKYYLQTQISTLGTFSAFNSDSISSMSELITNKLICQPRLFSPGGSFFEFPNTNILFDLNDDTDNIIVRVFNLSGIIKRKIESNQSFSRGHNILVWDGRDNDGNVVSSGLYIVTLENSGKTLKTTVGVLNR